MARRWPDFTNRQSMINFSKGSDIGNEVVILEYKQVVKPIQISKNGTKIRPGGSSGTEEAASHFDQDHTQHQ